MCSVNIGKNIRTLRNNRNLTQQQLAELTGLATITIQQYERGVREPRIDNLKRIAASLSVPLFVLTDCDILSEKELEKHKANNNSQKSDVQELNKLIEKREHEDALLLYRIIGGGHISKILEAACIMTWEGISEATNRFVEVSEIPKYQANKTDIPQNVPPGDEEQQKSVSTLDTQAEPPPGDDGQ